MLELLFIFARKCKLIQKKLFYVSQDVWRGNTKQFIISEEAPSKLHVSSPSSLLLPLTSLMVSIVTLGEFYWLIIN